MAKRTVLEEGDKRKINASSLKKIAGIFRFMMPYRWTFMWGLISLGLSSGTLLSFPYFAGKLLDVAQGKQIPVFSSINQIALALLGILIVQSVFSFIRVYTFTVVSEKALADLRHDIYQKIIWLPMSFFDS